METKTRNKILIGLIIAIILIVLFGISIPSLMRSRAPRPDAARETPAPIKITFRDYLLKSEMENPNYGLYSYLLFSKKPTTAKEIDRYVALHIAYRSLHSAKEYEPMVADSLLSTQNINITYWPLKVQPALNINLKDSLEKLVATDKFFIEYYDYVRADLILNTIRGTKSPGPFIVSYHYPLTRLPEEFEKDELLLIDLSRVDQGQFATILDYFQRKVLEAPATWHNKFDWELIRVHVYSALTLHGESILYAAKWVGDYFNVKQAFAKP